MKNEDLAIHFGIVPRDPDDPLEKARLGPLTADDDVQVYLSSGLEVYLAGSWRTWGESPAEDNDLHVVLHPHGGPLRVQIAEVRYRLVAGLDDGCRVLDYAVLSSRLVWSEQLGVVLLDTPDLAVLPKNVVES
jgi:hypothetical protein